MTLIETEAYSQDVILDCALCRSPLNMSGEQIHAYSRAIQGPTRFLTCPECRTLTSPDAARQAERLYQNRTSQNFAPGKNDLLRKAKAAIIVREYKNLLRSRGISRLVDYGCGNGDLANSLVAHGRETIAVDVQKDRPASLSPLVQYHCTETFTLPPREGRTAIVLRHVLEHISNPSETLETLAALLSVDDLLVLEFPYRDSALLELFGGHWAGFYPPFHVTVLDHAKVTEIASGLGLGLEAQTIKEPPLVAAMIAQRFGFMNNFVRLAGLAVYPLQWTYSRLRGSGEAVELVFQKK